MADDVKDMQKKLKEMELKAKLESKSDKRKMKNEKQKMKLIKKQEKMKAKLMKQGRLSPDDVKKMDISAVDKEKDAEGQKIAKAEVVEFKGKEWSRKSVQSMDEVEAKIDRFSGKGVQGLSDRYRQRYGEDLKVPELYQIETTIEMERDFYTESDEEELARIDKELEAAPAKDEGSSFFGRKKDKEKLKVEIDEDKPVLEPKFLDLSSAFFFLMKKFGAGGGGGKKAILALLDLIILIVLFPITIIRILTTIVFVMKRKKARKINSVSAADA